MVAHRRSGVPSRAPDRKYRARVDIERGRVRARHSRARGPDPVARRRERGHQDCIRDAVTRTSTEMYAQEFHGWQRSPFRQPQQPQHPRLAARHQARRWHRLRKCAGNGVLRWRSLSTVLNIPMSSVTLCSRRMANGSSPNTPGPTTTAANPTASDLFPSASQTEPVARSASACRANLN